MNNPTAHKFIWRLKWLKKSFFPLLAAVIFDFSKQPWRYILDYPVLPASARYLKSEYYLRKYFKYQDQGDSIFVDFHGLKFKIEKKFVSTPEQLNCLLVEYFDIIYASEVSFPIPGVMPEGPYEKDPVKLEPGDVVIDGGANFGYFSFFAANKIGPGGKVYAFEPISYLGESLESNKAQNKNGNIITSCRYALGNSQDDLEFSFSFENIGSASASFKGSEKIKVSQTTIDDFVQKNSLDKVSFIKMDIEGMERDALGGAFSTIKRFKPKLAICTYHYKEDRELLTQIIKGIRPDYNFAYSDMKLFAR